MPLPLSPTERHARGADPSPGVAHPFPELRTHMQHPLRTAAVLAVLALASACGDAPSPVQPPSSPQTAPAADADPVDPLTRALAGALADEALRMRLFADLRDSPFNHRLHLRSYLRGESGAQLLRAGAARTGQSPESLLALAESLGEMEILVPSELDRTRWTGTGDVRVFGSTRPGRVPLSRIRMTGYSLSGTPSTMGMFDRLPHPVLAILPSRTGYGTNPEEARMRAPRQTRRTIGLPDAGPAMDMVQPPCDLNQGCPGSGGVAPDVPPSGAIRLPSGYTTQCFVTRYSAGDADGDQLRDSCEYELAMAFRPYLSVSLDDYDLRREEYWAVQRAEFGGSPRIFYALSYYYDAGEDDTGYMDHYGDSEWLVVTVHSYSDGRWAVKSVKMSAHEGTPSDATRTYMWDELTYPSGVVGSRPLAYVSRNKHANYNSRGNCDAGSFWTDSCDGNVYAFSNAFYQVNVFQDRNLGNSTHSLMGGVEGCTRSRGTAWPSSSSSPRPVDPSRQECYWKSGQKFGGWLQQYFFLDQAGIYRESLVNQGF